VTRGNEDAKMEERERKKPVLAELATLKGTKDKNSNPPLKKKEEGKKKKKFPKKKSESERREELALQTRATGEGGTVLMC